MKPTVALIHWHRDEADVLLKRLQNSEFMMTHMEINPQKLKQLKSNPPRAFIISLERLPAQGRDIAIMLRREVATRHIPLIFVGGEPQKSAAIRNILPDATFCAWDKVQQSVMDRITNPVAKPMVPDSVFAAYKDRPLTQKLTIKPGMNILLQNPPVDIDTILGQLPKDVALSTDRHQSVDLTLCFVNSDNQLQQIISDLYTRAKSGSGPIWIIWPKKSGPKAGDLTQARVRKLGLKIGLVDYKICSLDKTWSGLLFTLAKPRKS